MLGNGRLAVALVVAALVAGCDAAGGSPAAPPDEGAGSSNHAGPVFTVGEALAELPASVNTREGEFTMLVGDVAKATELSGLSRPEDPADAGAWVSDLNGAMVDGEPPAAYVPLPAPLGLSTPAALVEEDLGWSVTDVDHFVSWTSWPLTTTVVGGDFDGQTLAGLPEAGGISSAGTGPDLTGDLQTASPARPQGIPLRMAVEDGWLIASPLTRVVEDWRNGPRRTLADDPVLSDLAAALDEAGAVSAKIATARSLGASVPPRAVLDRIREQSGSLDLAFAEFDTYAIGWTVEDREPGFVVAYHTTGDVDVALDRIAARWNGIDFRGRDLSWSVEVTGVEAAGDIVVVAARPLGENGGDLVMNMSVASDLPFISATGTDPSRLS